MGVHYDPLNYSDPGKFRPDRFLEAPNKVDMSNVYIPFGLDKQKEIGFRFTVLHVKLGIISILSSYSVGMNSKSAMEFDNEKVPIYPKEPLPIVFESILK
uniref:Cytochrome P450 n=2 Tax=Anoplophora glabripennis TaxID=217634 RepID=A0A8F8MYZ4_ANOGL|nr:cytochrome P450 [Anoplophora glabripennis]